MMRIGAKVLARDFMKESENLAVVRYRGNWRSVLDIQVLSAVSQRGEQRDLTPRTPKDAWKKTRSCVPLFPTVIYRVIQYA